MQVLLIAFIAVFAGFVGCHREGTVVPREAPVQGVDREQPKRAMDAVNREPGASDAIACATRIAAERTPHSDWVPTGADHQGPLWRVHFTMPNLGPKDRGGGLEVHVNMPECKQVRVLFQP
jgi:ABC-type cobalamin/Fe3+-siderophores transport system ATPase subunit